MGSTSTICSRDSNHRVAKVSGMAIARQTSHAGKYEPRMSKDGAREQLANINGGSNKTGLRKTRLLSLMVGLRCGKPILRPRLGPAPARRHRLIGHLREFAEQR